MDAATDDYSSDWQQGGAHAEPQDLAGPGVHGRLECTVTKPQKENEGTQNQFISYLVTTNVPSMPSDHDSSLIPMSQC